MSHPAFTDEDKVFIRAVLSNPAELTAWLVYADWLDEHGDPRAEFVRLMVRRGQLGHTEPEWHEVESRLQRLRFDLDPNWLAVFDRPVIENCTPAFAFRCPSRWENLRGTDDPAVRRCDTCRKPVHYCATVREAQGRARQGDCVAVQLGVPRSRGDLRGGGTADAAGEVLVRFIAAHNSRPDRRSRRPWWRFW